MHGRQPSGPGPIVDHLVDTGRGHGPVATDPQLGQMGQPMSLSRPQVAVKCLGGRAADRQRPRSAALAHHPHHPLVQVHVIQGHADAFGSAHPGVDQQQDDGAVTAAGELAPSQVLSSRVSCSARTTSTGCSGSWGGRMPFRGWTGGRLGHGPLEEGVQPAVAVMGGGRLPAGELVGDERLEVLAAKFAGEDRMAVGLAVGGQQPDGVGVGLDGPGALVLGLQGAAEASVKDQEVTAGSCQSTGDGWVDDIVSLIRVWWSGWLRAACSG